MVFLFQLALMQKVKLTINFNGFEFTLRLWPAQTSDQEAHTMAFSVRANPSTSLMPDIPATPDGNSIGGGGGDGAAWTYYPDEYRFGNFGYGGYTRKEFWALSAETLDPDLEGSGGEQANNLEESVMLHSLEAETIAGAYLRIFPTEIVIQGNAQGDPGMLDVQGPAFFRNKSWSIEHTVLGGINITAADVDRPDELPYSADEKSAQYALSVHSLSRRYSAASKSTGLKLIARPNYPSLLMDGNPIVGSGALSDTTSN